MAECSIANSFVSFPKTLNDLKCRTCRFYAVQGIAAISFAQLT